MFHFAQLHLMPMAFISFNIWGTQGSKTLVVGLNYLPAKRGKKSLLNFRVSEDKVLERGWTRKPLTSTRG